MKTHFGQNGFTLAEIMVVTALFSVVSIAGFMLFNAGQAISSVTLTRAELQESLRHISQRLILELSESGEDENGVMHVTILNNSGVNGTDVLRFSIPLCPCGVLPINENGETKSWGAPLVWGQSGCNAPYTIKSNGKVDICHLPPGNPNNPQDLQVNENAVKAHLAHNDWLGDCDTCDPINYTNRTIEYSVDNSGQLLRRVLDLGGSEVSASVIALNMVDFQASWDGGQDNVTITSQVGKNAVPNRTITLNGNWIALLRNKD